jgi:RNA polymerase sigma-70 factor (ECF subfamily)
LPAFTLIVQRFERPLFFYALRRVQNEEVARDVTQEVFLKLTEHAHRYNPEVPLAAWLYTVARNKCIDYLRKKRYREVSLDKPMFEDGKGGMHEVIPDQTPSTSSLVEAGEIASRLDEALMNINAQQRETFMLREVHGLKFIEIAELLEISENTVKSRMRYALEALRLHLDDFASTLHDSPS